MKSGITCLTNKRFQMSSIFPDTPKTLLDELARKGELDELKWRQFDELYRPAVESFIRQRFGSLCSEADDIVQTVILKLVGILRGKRYDSARVRFRTYLSAIIHNCCLDCLKSINRRREVPLEDFDIDAILGGSVEPESLSMLDRQWAEACHAAARRHVLEKYPLDPVHRQVFLDLERGTPISAVAENIGISQSSVRQIKHRILKLIEAFCQEYGD